MQVKDTLVISYKSFNKCIYVVRFVLSAVSPAVVVPSMLLLQNSGYGVEQGIPTLLMAAGSFDDILAITGFTTCLGIAFATGNTIKACFGSVLCPEYYSLHIHFI